MGNVGDSFAFLIKDRETAISLSAEHSLSIDSERERIRAMGVELYDGQVYFCLFICLFYLFSFPIVRWFDYWFLCVVPFLLFVHSCCVSCLRNWKY